MTAVGEVSHFPISAMQLKVADESAALYFSESYDI